jgi:hypothetical protein
MKFLVKKEDLYNGIKIVERATSMKALYNLSFTEYLYRNNREIVL